MWCMMFYKNFQLLCITIALTNYFKHNISLTFNVLWTLTLLSSESY